MKNLLLTVATAAMMGGFATATDYQPFVQEGKVWHMVREYYYALPDAPPNYAFDYFIYGDTVVGGIDYKKLFVYNSDNTHRVNYSMALREEEKKVYFVPDGGTDEFTLYDFNAADGADVVISTSALSDPYWFSTMLVLEQKSMVFNGVEHRLTRVINRMVYDDEPIEYAIANYSGWWIEGIGSDVNPFVPSMFGASGNQFFLTGCELNGEVLIDTQGLMKAEGRTPTWAADLTGDGLVDIDDVSRLVDIMLKKQDWQLTNY